MSDQRNLALVAPIGTPLVTPTHALSPGAQPLPSLMIQPPARDSLFPASDTGVQYLSQGPTGPIPISQSIDPSLTFVPGTGAHAAYQANLEKAADVALSFGPGVIGGQRAVTAPLRGEFGPYGGTGTLEAALMAEQGTHAFIPSDRDSIFNATGWFRGADDKWRFVIPDEGARLRTENLRSRDYTNYKGETYQTHSIPFAFGSDPQLKLGDVLDHPDLYNAYPWAKDIEVRGTPLGNIMELNGAYDKDANRMYITGGKADETLSTVLHETQHAIQDREGFARGGSVAEFLPSTHDENMRRVDTEKQEIEKEIHNLNMDPSTVAGTLGFYPYDRPMTHYPDNIKQAVAALPQDVVDRYRDVQTRYGDLMGQKSAAVQSYLNLGGEIEARSVQAMLHEHQWSRPPWEVPMGRDFLGNPIPYPEQTEHIIRFNEPGPGGQAGVVLTPVEHDPFARPRGR